MHISENLLNFFMRELDNYRENVRNGNLDPADGFHPTVSSALDSFQQAPLDIQLDWMEIDAEYHADIPVEDVIKFLTELAWLIEIDSNAKLTDWEWDYLNAKN